MSSRNCNWHIRTLACVLLATAVGLPMAAVTSPEVAAAEPINAQSTNPFPAAEPERVGLSAQAVAKLDQQMQSLVAHDQIVGGELLVIKNRHTVFRKAFGWKDREAGVRMPVDAIYCVRSMTKPLVGTAIQMLIDDGLLRLDTPVRALLPSFDGPRTGRITIQHLLTHTAGFPLTTMAQPLSGYADLGEVAAEAAESRLLFEPGTDFEYSDSSADTLGAVVARISGMPLEAFIQSRILDPLGMSDSIPLLGNRLQARSRIPAAYSGGTGAWSKHWDASDPPLFPIFLGSQGLYSTTSDYARFLALWMDQGKIGERQLLSAAAVARALKPAHRLDPDPYAASDLTVETGYGQQWVVRTRHDGHDDRELEMFGHDGSDGTHAWAWPEQDLMVLLFTQSRRTRVGREIHGMVEAVLLRQDSAATIVKALDSEAQTLDRFAGIYWDEDVAHAYYVISAHGDRIELDRPGGMHAVFRQSDRPERFVAEANPKVWIAFEPGADGKISEMQTYFGGRIEHDPKHVPVTGLPTVRQLVERVHAAHGIDGLAQVGAIRLRGTINYKTRGIRGSVTNIFSAEGNRVDVAIGGSRQSILTDGKRAWTKTRGTGLDEMSGRLLQQTVLDRLPVLLGDWTRYYSQVEVLKRIEHDGQRLILLRLATPEGIGGTLFVDEVTGRLIRTDTLSQVPGIGIVGVQTMFEDVRDVEGMQIPFRMQSKFEHPLIGIVEVQYTKAETGVATKPTAFAPKSARRND